MEPDPPLSSHHLISLEEQAELATLYSVLSFFFAQLWLNLHKSTNDVTPLH